MRIRTIINEKARKCPLLRTFTFLEMKLGKNRDISHNKTYF
nr:MAG TPA: hypothetical protein [Caudoviricetes sp.]